MRPRRVLNHDTTKPRRLRAGVGGLVGGCGGAGVSLLGASHPAQVVLTCAAAGAGLGALMAPRPNSPEETLIWRTLLVANLVYYAIVVKPLGSVLDALLVLVSVALAAGAALTFHLERRLARRRIRRIR